MVKLRKAELKGFRGARFPFSIDLEKDSKNIAIFGENASGKSTVSDALEWFFYDRVDYLWKEDCEEQALRHVALPIQESAEVRLEFDDPALDACKRLDGALAKSSSNNKPQFAAYLAQSRAERIVLRNAYLQDFVLKSKSEKRNELARIIGFDELMRFRETIQRVLTWTRDDTHYATAKENLERCRSRLLRGFKRIPRDDAEYVQLANDLVEQFKLPIKITDANTYEGCIQALTARITDPKKGEKIGVFNTLKTNLDDFKTALSETDQRLKTFLPSYQAIIQNIEKLKSIDLVAFLSKGKEVIEKGVVEAERCPFCLQPVTDIAHLIQEVTSRILELEEVSKEQTALRTRKNSLVQKLRSVSTEAGIRYKEVSGLGIVPELCEKLRSYKDYVNTLADTVAQRFDRFEVLDGLDEHEEHITGLLPLIEDGMLAAGQMIQTLTVSAEEEAFLQARDNLKLLRTDFRDILHFAKIKEVYELQIKSLSTLLDEFINKQSSVLQEALDMMSDDISDFYLDLHPNENVDNIRLKIIGEQGVEFIYSFHGREVHPPRKYLSESHLNSLGIALFLASVKLFNKTNGFFVLDDVVTSFDLGHRLRLLRLLQEKFCDYQILLLTHEDFWFEMIKKDMPAASWLFSVVDWSYERGIEMKRAVKDLKQLIELKRKQGHDVGNDMRKLLEMILKEIAFHLGVRVPFRFNETNERRDVGELLSEIQGTINRKSPGMKNDPIWQRLLTCSLVASTASHHPGVQLSEGDIDTILEDVRYIEALFLCDEKNCNSYVSLKKHSQTDKKVYCSCGKKAVEWKD